MEVWSLDECCCRFRSPQVQIVRNVEGRGWWVEGSCSWSCRIYELQSGRRSRVSFFFFRKSVRRGVAYLSQAFPYIRITGRERGFVQFNMAWRTAHSAAGGTVRPYRCRGRGKGGLALVVVGPRACLCPSHKRFPALLTPACVCASSWFEHHVQD